MCRLALGVGLSSILAVAAVLALSTAAGGQGIGCDSVGDYILAEIGVPSAEGTTLPAQLSSPEERLGVHFTVGRASAASLYVGDQLYDLDLYLYARGRCPAGRWSSLVRAWSTRS